MSLDKYQRITRRWSIALAGISIGLCVGSVYSWSVFNKPIAKELGIVGTWKEGISAYSFSMAIITMGICAAFGGSWLEKVGPKITSSIAAIAWPSALLLAAFAIQVRSIWVLLFGFGIVGGIGLGLAYISPVSTLIKFFPKNRGLAAGMAVMGFGGGSIITSPIAAILIIKFGVFYCLIMISFAHFLIMIICAQLLRFPTCDEIYYFKNSNLFSYPPLDQPFPQPSSELSPLTSHHVISYSSNEKLIENQFEDDSKRNDDQPLDHDFKFSSIPLTPLTSSLSDNETTTATTMEQQEENSMAMRDAVKTKQFWMMWIILFVMISSGISILSQLSPILQEVFLCSEREASVYISLISFFNLGGRLFWATLSDFIGRKITFLLFTSFDFIFFLLIPTVGYYSLLLIFLLLMFIIFSMYGGTFASIPAWLADGFGSKNVGSVHGVILTAWSAAAAFGPVLITLLRSFRMKSVTEESHPIHAYDITFYIIAALLFCAFILVCLWKPLPPPRAAVVD